MTTPLDSTARIPEAASAGQPSDASGLERLAAVLAPTQRSGQHLVRHGGKVVEVGTAYVRVIGLQSSVSLGSIAQIDHGGSRSLGQVIGIHGSGVTVKLFDAAPRIGLGEPIWVRDDISLRPSRRWLGRVIDALGRPIDGLGPLIDGPDRYSVERGPSPPMHLDRIRTPIRTGVRVVDLFTPLCAGQRIGVFAGSGIGKTTLLSMIARAEAFQTMVVALVAERGREVREFVEDVVGPRIGQTVTVVASSAEGAMMRRLAAKTAMAVAEHFRDRGDSVLLVVDSVTRFAHALREVALAAGEPPVARGYPPSVFAELPLLLERAGPGTQSSGTITGIFSVLVDGDDHNDPIADSVRGILDGHIVLDRAVADLGRYPAVNISTSISRLANLSWSREQANLILALRRLLARFEETRDLRAVGAYQPGSDPELDQAVAIAPVIYRVLSQNQSDPPSTDAFRELAAATAELRQAQPPHAQPAQAQAPHAHTLLAQGRPH